MPLQCTECGKIIPPLCCHTCRPSGNTLRGFVLPHDMHTIKEVADTLRDVAEYLAKSHCAVCRRAATDIVSNATSRLWPITHRRENTAL